MSTVRVRPTTKSDREWYASLNDETRTEARKRVAAMIEQGIDQGHAWTHVRGALDTPAQPVFDAVVHPKPEPSAAKSSKRAPKPASDATATPERTRGRAAAICSFWLNDKPRRNLSDLAYDATRGMAGDAPRMTAADFRAYLTAQGIAEPDAAEWCIELPNGNVICSTLRDGGSSLDEMKSKLVKAAA